MQSEIRREKIQFCVRKKYSIISMQVNLCIVRNFNIYDRLQYEYKIGQGERKNMLFLNVAFLVKIFKV